MTKIEKSGLLVVALGAVFYVTDVVLLASKSSIIVDLIMIAVGCFAFISSRESKQ